MAASIEIDDFLTGSHVQQTFRARGTYVPGNGSPMVSCALKRSGLTIASGTATTEPGNCWYFDFSGITPNSGYSLCADITDGTSDSEEQPEITVDGDPPVILDPTPAPTPEPLPEHGPPKDKPGARVEYNVSGKHSGVVKHLICAAVHFSGVGNANKMEKVDAVAIGVSDNRKWTAKLNVSPLPAGKKLGILVIGLNAKGQIIGRAFRRRK